MNDFEKKVINALSNLSEGQAELRSEFSELKEGQAELHSEFSELKKGQDELRGEFSELKKDVRRLEVLHEETAEKIDQILEAVSPEMEKTNDLQATTEDHEERITLLEKAAQT